MNIQVERVSDDIYVFTSDVYAQVTAGAVVSPAGTVLIDTLAFPYETNQIKNYIQDTLHSEVKYVINTHYHADHVYGTYLFPNAHVISHGLCRRLLQERVIPNLAIAKKDTPEIREVQIVLPDITFDHGQFVLHLGNKTLLLTHSPGHSPDLLTVLVKEERVLFASDMIMPLPFFPDGNPVEFTHSIQHILHTELENIIQGHGEVILRGEIPAALESRLSYLDEVRKLVTQVIKRGRPASALKKITLESMGRSQIDLAGLVAALHERNIEYLYQALSSEVDPWPSVKKKN